MRFERLPESFLKLKKSMFYSVASIGFDVVADSAFEANIKTGSKVLGGICIFMAAREIYRAHKEVNN